MATPVLAPRTSQKSSPYQPRQPNVLQAIFRRHYAAFAESYPSRHACHYVRFRLPRITEVSEAFIRCGDYPSGGSRRSDSETARAPSATTSSFAPSPARASISALRARRSARSYSRSSSATVCSCSSPTG